MTKNTSPAKPSYAELIARRSGGQRRTVTKPLCLDMELRDAYLAAKQEHADAVKEAEQSAADGEKTPGARYSDKPAADAAAEKLQAAAEAMEAMSLWVVYRIPSALEQDRLVAQLDTLTDDKGTPVSKGSSEWVIGYLAGCFDHATTMHGARLEDFTADDLRHELEMLPMGLLLDQHRAIVDGITTTDFPTQRRP